MSSVRLSVTVDDCIVCRTFMKIGTVFRNKFSNNCESWVFNAVTAPLTSKAYNNCEVFFFYGLLFDLGEMARRVPAHDAVNIS